MGCDWPPDDILNIKRGDLVLIGDMQCLCVSEPRVREAQGDEAAGHAGDVIVVTFDAVVGCDIRHVKLVIMRSWFRVSRLCDIEIDGMFLDTLRGETLGIRVVSGFDGCE